MSNEKSPKNGNNTTEIRFCRSGKNRGTYNGQRFHSPRIHPAVRLACGRNPPQRCDDIRPAYRRPRNSRIRLVADETTIAVQNAVLTAEITYINLYIIPLSYIDSHNTPFLYFARSEGELLYCSERYHFRRPKYKPDFAKAYADARFHFDTFRTLGFELLEQANHELAETRNMRLAGMFAAQAAVYFYHTLYYVYHQMEFDSHDPLIMHERMRTLSTRLMLIYDDDNIRSVQTLASLKHYLLKSPYDKDFDVSPRDMAVHIERTTKAAEIIESCCGLRLELYQELGGM